MSAISYAHPTEFETVEQPTLDVDDDRIQYDFDTLVARRGRTYIFLDYLFESRNSNLHGAVGTRMMPVHEDSFSRRKERLFDKGRSPLRHIYEEQDVAQHWEEWIEAQYRATGPRLLYDSAYPHYWEPVKERAEKEGVMERGEIAVVECVGGGRLLNEIQQDHDEVYDDELWRLIKRTEYSGVSALY